MPGSFIAKQNEISTALKVFVQSLGIYKRKCYRPWEGPSITLLLHP